MVNKLSWSFAGIWNDSLTQREERKIEARDRIWASELGGAYIDRWYKMKGFEPSNPFDNRSLRKFEAGRLFEWITKMVLTRAGLLIDDQRWLKYEYPDLLPVTGKLDHLAGGKPDYDKALAEFSNGEFPELITRATRAVITHFKDKYPDGLKKVVLEVKSVGSHMFHRYNIYKMADPKHSLQLYHYLKAGDFDEGHIVYISKDDLCLTEVGILKNDEMENRYRGDIEQITGYLKSGEEPPKEDPIDFDEIAGRFYVNWKIGYSQYLTAVYGYKNQGDFESQYKPMVARWNRVVGRIASEKKMTDDNKKAIEEMREFFPNLDDLLKISKERKATEEEYKKKGGDS